MSAECLIPRKHTLKMLCKSNHFPRRYKRNREWVFFSEHSVDPATDYMLEMGRHIEIMSAVPISLASCRIGVLISIFRDIVPHRFEIK